MRSALIIVAFTIFVQVKSDETATPTIRKKLHVQGIELSKCDGNGTDPIWIEDFKIKIGDGNQVHVGGKVHTSKDLSAPIKTAVILKMKSLLGWVTIPCRNNTGSCTFDDICTYGFPEDVECPQLLADNGIPCRCPISKGTYMLPETSFQKSSNRTVITGKYKANFVISHEDYRLACYNVNFALVRK